MRSWNTVALCAAFTLLAMIHNTHASWTWRKVFSGHWKNGLSLLCREFGRSESESLALLKLQGPEFKDEFQNVCLQWARMSEAHKDTGEGIPGSPIVVDLRNKAKGMFDTLFGKFRKATSKKDPRAAKVDFPGPRHSVSGDPMNQQLMALRAQHQQQKQKLLAQLQQDQQAEWLQLEEHLLKLRQRQNMAANESQKVERMLEEAKRHLLEIHNRVKHVAGAASVIESIKKEAQTAIETIKSFDNEQEAPPGLRKEFERLEKKANHIKSVLGTELSSLNTAFHTALEQFDSIENYANRVGSSLKEIRDAVEPHLVTSAQYRVKLGSLETVVRDSISMLEKKQVDADATLLELHNALQSVLSAACVALQARVKVVVEFARDSTVHVQQIVKEEAMELLRRIHATIESAGANVVDWAAIAASYEELYKLFVVWDQKVQKSKAAIDGAFDASKVTLDEIQELPPQHRDTIDIQELNNSLEVLSGLKSTLRSALAEVSGRLQVLEAIYNRGMQGLHGRVGAINPIVQQPLYVGPFPQRKQFDMQQQGGFTAPPQVHMGTYFDSERDTGEISENLGSDDSDYLAGDSTEN